jgi:predicted nucleic acid-binding protein
MAFVLDASVALAWAFADETHPVAEAAAALIRDDEGCVPSLWWFEVRNVLIVNERRGRLREADTMLFLRILARLPIVVDRSPEEVAVLTLARGHGLTVYDASYLELAKRRTAPLATLDLTLAQAAQRENIALIGDKTA